jgi:hypothetical protein
MQSGSTHPTRLGSPPQSRSRHGNCDDLVCNYLRRCVGGLEFAEGEFACRAEPFAAADGANSSFRFSVVNLPGRTSALHLPRR